MPTIDSSLISSPDDDDERPLDTILGLPSDIDLARHADMEIIELAKLELKLWEGVAYDIISSLKEEIKYKKCFLNEKQRSLKGVRQNTRSNQALERLQKVIERTRNQYNFVREHLIRLGLPEDDKRFQPIGKKDLWMMNINTPRNRRGTARGSHDVEPKIEPWYWRTTWNSEASSEEKSWSIEGLYSLAFSCSARPDHISTADRVRWHRQRAERDRHEEEVEILKEELRRVMRTHKKFYDLWLCHVVEQPSSRLEMGRNAYAMRTAAMHESLRAHAENMYAIATKPRFEMDL